MRSATAGFVGLCVALAAAAVWPARAGDSIGYRGKNTSGLFEERGLLKRWPEPKGPELLWKRYVGDGWAGPLVQDGRVYVLGGNPARLHVLTLDGEELQTIPMGPSDWKRFRGARSTPLKYGNLVLGQTPNANIYAVDLDTQTTRWVRNAWRDFGSGKGHMSWGVPESPMRHGDLYIFNPVSRDEQTPGIAAINAFTGQLAWGMPGRKLTPEDPRDRWSGTDVSGAVFTHNGRALVAYPTWTYLACADAATGRKLWDIRKADGTCGLTPVYSEGRLLWDPAGRAQMLKLSPDGADYEVLWTGVPGPAGYSHAVILNGRVYYFGSSSYAKEAGPTGKAENLDRLAKGPPSRPGAGGIVCLDADTGELLHFEPIPTTRAGHLWTADGLVYAWWLAGANPEVGLLRPTEKGFEIASRFRVPVDAASRGVSDVDWQVNTCPAIADGRLFLRYGSLFVYDLRIEQPAYGWRVDGSGHAANATPPLRWSRADNVAWTCALPGRALSAPAVQGGALYVTTEAGLACARDGRVTWTRPLDAAPAASRSGEPTPATRDGRVYAASSAGALACFDSAGAPQWKADVTPAAPERPVSSPILCEGLVVVQGARLQAHRVGDGGLAWELPAPAGRPAQTPVRCRLDDGLILFTSWGAAVRAADGKVVAEGLPVLEAASPAASDRAVFFHGGGATGKVSSLAAFALPAAMGEKLQLTKLWARDLDFACDGTPLAHADRLYLLGPAGTLRALDAATGRTVHEQPLVPEAERQPSAARTGAGWVVAGGRLYAANVGARGRTVLIEPGAECRKVWEYAAKDAAAWDPAFELDRQYVCAGATAYAIAGRTPTEPLPPAVLPVAPDAMLDGASDLPTVPFASDRTPANWTVVGPFQPKTLETDFLKALGGASNALLRAGQEVAYRGKSYPARGVGANDWFKHGNFTRDYDSLDLTALTGRQFDRTLYLFTVLENDAERCVEFRLLSPGGIMWNTAARLDALVWFAGRPIRDGTVCRLAKGRYPLAIQVAMGTCESWGKIWMAPRFTDVTERIAERQRDYERAMALWPGYQKTLARLFVLGE